MPRQLLALLRSLLAVVAGYILMSFLITLVFEVWLGGVSFHGSSRSVLALSGACAFLSALAGGWAAGWIAGRAPFLHAAVMSLLVALETTWLLTSRPSDDPLWFDLAGSATLVLGLLAGAWLHARLGARSPEPVVG